MRYVPKKTTSPDLYDELLRSIRTGDIMLSSNPNLVNLITSLWLRSTIQHVGIFVWVNQHGIQPAFSLGCSLCILHTNYSRTYDCQIGIKKRGLALEPFLYFVMKSRYIVYWRPLDDNVVDRQVVSKQVAHFCINSRKYKYDNAPLTLLSLLTGLLLPGESDNFLCSNFVSYFLTLCTSYGQDDEYAKLPNRDIMTYRPSDFTYANNQSRVFAGEEKVIYKAIDESRIVILNPIILSLIILCIIILLIVMYMLGSFVERLKTERTVARRNLENSVK
jgi:hypothetical protein